MSDDQSNGINVDASGNATIGGDAVGRDKITSIATHYYGPLPIQPRRAELLHQPYFFGREDELNQIADALDPDSRGWGVLIDGPGGIGKTALAIRAGHLAPDEHYPTKIFLSAKVRELTPQGEQPLQDFMLPNYMALLAELAHELGEADIEKIDPSERARTVRRALENRKALIIVDNLETFDEKERVRLFQFLSRLPRSCKAIVTSRRRTDVEARVIRLDRLSPEAAQSLISELAKNNKHLARASEKERQQLYETARGNPLLIKWLAGQLGRGHCRTIADVCKFIEAAPKDNDPLAYIFGDLLDTFTESETAVLAALAHFTQPAKVKWIAEIAGISESAAQTALEDLTDRALLVSDARAEAYLLPSLAATFLRRKRPEVIAQASARLTDGVYALALENGYRNYGRFPVLEAEWPRIATALPLFIHSKGSRLQRLCNALRSFLNFSGRWDERLALCLQAEEQAIAMNATYEAGWRSQQAGYIYYLRGQAAEVLGCAQRAEKHWEQAGAHEKSTAIRLRGLGLELMQKYPAALSAFEEALSIRRAIGMESRYMATVLNDIGRIEQFLGNYAAAESRYREALRVAEKVGDHSNSAEITGNLARLALVRQNWPNVEAGAREALSISEKIGRQELIGANCSLIAKALARQGRKAEGLLYAQRAVEIFTKLHSKDLEEAQAVLQECEGGSG